eukprot:CAMPEP_0117049212 /NCGR_PEP_ID=MMETSP0472-20121206/33998_1 /TAXON_ID=693140 ORGANISM="Tiarina fusus, Strain LIS" /NCGR_SAMPLE_ID=MMETSP0472 /ASSEMBLY_ACC=CAM_ASM_000603 /LENGTH=486 /DNA_ID=CAMNT_0004762567 /DNA_START=145 /DNA_END=1605 /DNA_ORIENTATION=+
MDNQSNQQSEADSKPRAAIAPAASGPEWRSVAIAPSQVAGFPVDAGIPRPMNIAGATTRSYEVIDKAAYLNTAVAKEDTKKAASSEIKTNWAPAKLRPVPAFYPLERSSRFVEDNLVDVVSRVSEANRVLSVHAVYCNETATASLLTAENVEMHLSLWKAGGNKQPEGIAVELQRRRGDSIAFHRYSKYILDAAVGDFSTEEHLATHGEDLDIVYSKRVHRLLTLEEKEAATEWENAVIAIEIAHGLLMKDRMDARQLGLESLCLLTDPNKTGKTTALIASQVVLLGTAQSDGSGQDDDNLMFDEAPFQEIRQTILSLIQLRRIGDADDFEAPHSVDEEHITVLHNLALAVLANALDVIENEEKLEQNPEVTAAASRDRTSSASEICESFLADADEVAGNREIIKTLISELGKAGDKPHNACLSAKCIGSLCRASEKARRKAKELGAKTVVQTALDVGTRTHLKLEKECTKVMTTLTNTTEPETGN